MRTIYILAIWLLASLAHSVVYAIPTSTLAVEFREAPFSKDLTQQTVTQTFQDSRGALWLATQEGLNKYTGLQLQNYRHNPGEASSISSNMISRITEDGSGNIWIATVGGGLNRYNSATDNFLHLKADPNVRDLPLSNSIYAVYWDSMSEVLWLGYLDGISVFNPKDNTFWHFTTAAGAIPHTGAVYDFALTQSGDIWAGTEAAGLVHLKLDYQGVKPLLTASVFDHALLNYPITRALATTDDTLWLATRDNGVIRYRPSEDSIVSYTHVETDRTSLSSNKVFDLFQDRSDRIWIATYDGLDLYSPTDESFVNITQASSNLPTNIISSIYQSREGVYWMGTLYGFTTGNQVKFPKFDANNTKLSGNGVNAFAETSDGSLWVGTDNGLNRLRPGDMSFEWINEFSNPSISSSVVMSLMGNNSTLWIGTYNAGLNILDLESEQVKTFRHSKFEPKSIGANGITSILKTKSGLVLVGTYGGGLSTMTEKGELLSTYQHSPEVRDSISNDMVISIYEDSLGLIWIGTEFGLNRFDPKLGTFNRFFSDSGVDTGLTSNLIWAFHEDENGNLWIGSSGGGLISWPKANRKSLEANFVSHSQSLGLSSSDIYGIQSDSENNLWLSHNRGITRLNVTTGTTTKYGIKDGLQSTEFNMGATYKGNDNAIYFGGPKGFNVIPGGFVDEGGVPPIVNISSIKIMNAPAKFDEPLYQLGKIELSYKDKFITIETYAADYFNPSQVQYAYRLEGLQTDWIISDESHIASFTTLPPGEYRLKFAASTPSGVWNWNALEIPIYAHPPPWKSNLAYSFYLASIATAAYYFYRRHKLQQLKAIQRQKELEKKVEERTIDLEKARAVAETANSAKSKFLATVTHEIRTPMHGMIGMTELLLNTTLTPQQRQFAQAAHNSGKSLLVLINDLLDFSKVEASKVEIEKTSFDLVSLLDEACYLQSEPAHRKGVALYNCYNTSIPKLIVGDPTKIRQVIMNLLSNAIKFTHKGEVKLEAFFIADSNNADNSRIVLTVRDTGIGMEPDIQEKIFETFAQADSSTTREYGGTGLGLSISKQYVELMGGSIEVNSQPGKGSAFTISIPTTEYSKRHIPIANHPERIHVLCEDESAYEMIQSHLELLGYSSQRNVNSSENLNQVFVILSEKVSEHPDMIGRETLLRLNSESRGIVLTSAYSPIKSDFFPTWPRLSTPIKLDSLNEVLRQSFTKKSKSLSRDETRDFNRTEKNSYHILVAEDVETNQHILSETLKLLGHTCDIANDGIEAIELYKARDYDMIFMDCRMPNKDGFDATKEIRSLEDKTNRASITIVALTAGLEANDVSQCFESGMDHYISKPFTIEQIETCISGVPKRLSNDNRLIKSSNRTTSQLSLNSENVNHETIGAILKLSEKAGPDFIDLIFSNYSIQMSEKLEHIQNEVNSGNLDVIPGAIHAIKSMSLNVGASGVTDICEDLEFYSKRNSIDIEYLQEKIERIYHELDKFNVYISDRYLSSIT